MIRSKFAQLSLKNKFFFSILIVILLISGAIALLARWILISGLTQELEMRGTAIAHSVATRGTEFILENDTARLLNVIFDEKNTALCAIEEAYNQGLVSWKKPISCHLYPVRVKDFSEFAAVNYHKWDICDDACSLGKELQVPVYKFLKESLIRKFGENWYSELEKIAEKQGR